ncbi:uncharacterized protein I303_107467 [Kwoniella dejecticola CBS 10117]|uniref:C2H2-type domain-containing protein n=1 Tax=Kwoniella dejecticola CBS 10117 TaxID=1296121 RepID=A0A1A5ZZT8_9TREE|nr:uncharacterized protein I303_06873 [Kwoniella dejecticola CBS 10117]OBR83308.1 hypothetical protein I303_06873 [Kwoniella dejecticola CBS 10117]
MMLVSPRPAPLLRSLDNPLSPPLVSPSVKIHCREQSPPSSPIQDDEEAEDEYLPQASGSGPRSRSTSAPACRTERKFKCRHEGCDKAYFKPSRLAEHELTHTGERPHKCPECGQSYLRASHLTAHMRTHLSADAKPFKCERDRCGKAFWTATHLKRHEDTHDKAEVYPCHECDQTFAKAHLLREHHALVHMPEGTKLFQCPHEGCDKSFNMKAHLRAHEKTHDANRYTCSHPSHGTDFPSFPVWSALQTHIQQAHPPICPHAECNGRAFKNAQRLKDHLKVHDQQAADKAALALAHPEGELPLLLLEGISRSKRRRISQVEKPEDGGASPKLRRVKSGESGKDWWCDEEGCEKRFKTKFALESHRKAIHLSLRPHICPIEGCGKSFPHKSNLTRHVASHSRPTTPIDRDADNSNGLVGKVKEVRRFGCPAHAFQKFIQAPPDVLAPTPTSETPLENEDSDRCLKRFWRVYDIRRHLVAEHNIEIEDMECRRLLIFDRQG